MIARPNLVVAAVLTLVTSACSGPTADINPADLSPQFGTFGYDSVEHVAYGKAGLLYAVGSWSDERDTDSPPQTKTETFLRRYNSSGHLPWETFFDVDPAYDRYGGRGVKVSDMAVDGSGNVYIGWRVEYQIEDKVWKSTPYLSKIAPDGRLEYRKALWVDQLVVDPGGNAYVHSDDELIKFSPTGSQVWLKRGFWGVNIIEDLTLLGTDNIYTVSTEGLIGKYQGSTGARIWKKKVLPSFSEVTTPPVGTCSSSCGEGVSYRIQAGLADEVHVVGGRYTVAFNQVGGLDYSHEVNFFRFDPDGARLVRSRLFTADRESCGPAKAYCPPYSWPNFELAADRDGRTYVATSLGGDASVTKVGRWGVRLWSKRFGAAEFDVALDVAAYRSGEVFIGGMTDGDLVHRQLGGGDAFLTRLDGRGNRIWTR